MTETRANKSISLDAGAPTSGAYPYLVVFVLAVAYMLNFVDRQLLSILVEPIKGDLGLSDTQIGLLTGLMFALFYTFFGIPVALVADRSHRVRLIALSCAVWSLFTALSGLAKGFVSLAAARVGVGIGEAGCSPPSYSLISDYFPPHRRGRALALYVLGIPAGSFVGVALGGWIADALGWRAAFFILGGAGLVFAPILLLVVREPARGRLDETAGPETQPRGSVFETLAYFWRSPVFVLTGIGCGLTAFCGNALLNWSPAYLMRVQAMSMAEIGSFFAVAAALSLAASAWLGALIADKAGARHPAYLALLPGISVLVAAPLLYGFGAAPGWQQAIIFLVPAMICTGIYFVPALTLLQNRTPAAYRATVSSILLFIVNLIGLGAGPLYVGALSDALAPAYGKGSIAIALQGLAPFALAAFGCQLAAARLLRRQN